ncbi:MAG TPA: SDR family oxidoreductase [Geminicoccus sp.]|jgi:2-deoxy-D-gluconate 3-dehydrogenase|uniref:SDR family NAD(P)-dependent oxidoreductase n=1 Tax=Geminicoccus sp. TaxID=2024832 RepID=UPI002E315C41|nr:SDR family oxidoreductase [Geminicoccus sp.]HEX2528906.1 SDR family oxidoreductase [Geminicoccus sp.]
MSEFVERFSVTNRKALVTGASKGIGAETCRVLADAGADIVAVARDPSGLAETKAAVEAKGRRCLVIEADLSSIEETRAAAQNALDAWGTIDILVNNAAIGLVESLLEASMESFDKVMAINLRAPLLMAQMLAPGMIAQRRGKIINVSSQTGVIALVDHATYAASKAGLNAMTKVMAAEWSRYNIQANAVCPTVIMTPMGEKFWSDPARYDPFVAKVPLGRTGKPIEVADLILFLASSASDLITGDNIMIDGGYTAL